MDRQKTECGAPGTQFRPVIGAPNLDAMSFDQFEEDDYSVAKRAADNARDRGTRHERVCLAAYHRARLRGFEPGHELEDWLAGEAEVGTES